MSILITCPSVTSRQTSTQYPVTLYREFLNYVKTRYAGEYWHALPKEVAAQVTSEWLLQNERPIIRRGYSA